MRTVGQELSPVDGPDLKTDRRKRLSHQALSVEQLRDLLAGYKWGWLRHQHYGSLPERGPLPRRIHHRNLTVISPRL